jgi:hypothetical protein
MAVGCIKVGQTCNAIWKATANRTQFFAGEGMPDQDWILNLHLIQHGNDIITKPVCVIAVADGIGSKANGEENLPRQSGFGPRAEIHRA